MATHPHLPAALAATLTLALLAAGPSPVHATDDVDFARDVLPILRRSCSPCHGARKQKGELRLDVRDAALAGGLSGRVIVPGQKEASLLYRAISGQEKDLSMPPEGEPRLAAQEVRILGAWIDGGAPWPEALAGGEASVGSSRRHWAFEPVTRPPAPTLADASWPADPLDAFILARLEARGLAAAPRTDAWTLARRTSLDLLGLPPAPEEADALAADTSPDACSRYLDRLLASPRLGERWARWWLDLARYADTNGYEKDKPRSIWRYRDWVIDAFNSDIPFDRFTVEQLAGDLLPEATVEQRIATGFHRNTMINEEGGANQEQFRHEAIIDRVNTTGAAFLGLTVGCAQCHSHKYDPVSQREYYQLYAFFNNADEPLLAVPTEDERGRLAAHEARLAELEAELLRDVAVEADGRVTANDEGRASAIAGEPAWEAQEGALTRAWTLLEPTALRSEGGAEFVRLPDGSILVEGPSAPADTYTIEAEVPLEAIAGLRIEVLPHRSLPAGGPGRGRVLGDGNFVLSEVRLEAAQASSGRDVLEPVAWSRATADFSQQGFEAQKAIDGDLESGWSIEAGKPGRNVARRLVLEARESSLRTGGSRLRITLVHNYTHEHTIGRFRLAVTPGPRPVESTGLSPDVEEALRTPRALRTPAQARAVQLAYRLEAPGLADVAARLVAERAGRPAVTTTLVLEERSRPRVSHVKLRGEFLRDGDVVTPDVPAALPPLPDGARRDRLALARWIVSPENPLTPRVVVNRLWQALFGRGLVTTPEDFGTRADAPSHPGLLDTLAADLTGAGAWRLKPLLRRIALSSTYQQSAVGLGAILERAREVDPENTLLWHAPRVRLEAEMVRDAALAAAGVLSGKIGGPSVFPPQPAGVNSLSWGGFEWRTSGGEDRYRRGLYTYMKRTSPYPGLTTFDAPSGETACARRARTDTPLQALVLLNDEVFLDAARALARRVLAEPLAAPPTPARRLIRAEAEGADATRLERAFRLVLTRRPDEGELARLAAYLESMTERYRARPDDAAKVIGLGDAEARDEEPRDLARRAAWTLLARVLLNLDGAITRE